MGIIKVTRVMYSNFYPKIISKNEKYVAIFDKILQAGET